MSWYDLSDALPPQAYLPPPGNVLYYESSFGLYFGESGRLYTALLLIVFGFVYIMFTRTLEAKVFDAMCKAKVQLARRRKLLDPMPTAIRLLLRAAVADLPLATRQVCEPKGGRHENV